MTITMAYADDERDDALRALSAGELALVLWDMDQWLRAEVKYRSMPYDDVRGKLHELLDDYGVSLEDGYVPRACACGGSCGGREPATDGDGSMDDDAASTGAVDGPE